MKKFLATPLLVIVVLIIGTGIVAAGIFFGGEGRTGDVSLQKGLVGHWKFAGNAKDATPNGNDGVVTGAALIEDRKGAVNQAYNFNGTTDVITVPSSSSLSPTSAVTIAGWVYDPPLAANSPPQADEGGPPDSNEPSGTELNILNPHSSPKAGENWIVSFTTKGTADLSIIPNDQNTIDDLDFISLKCGDEIKTPQILQGDVIFYPDWQCDEIGEITHLVNTRGNHTFKFQFGDKLAYAYNAADVTIEAAANSYSELYSNRGGVFWTTPLIGYVIYINSSSDLVYNKTTNGGTTWDGSVAVKAGTSISYDAWADWQTAGDTGTKIHIAYLDIDTDDARYVYLDTATDTVGGDDQIEACQGTGSMYNITAWFSMISITKTRGGNLAVAFKYADSTITVFYKFYTSPDGNTWTSKTNLWESWFDNRLQLYPANLADNNDLWAIFHDTYSPPPTHISLKTFDNSANSWSEANIATMLLPTTTVNFGGQVRLSDGDLIVAFWNAYDTATADLQVYDIANASSITAKTNIITDEAESIGSSVFIDQTNDDIYVAYFSGYTSGNTVSTFYQKSTDGGANWGGETAMQADAEDDERWVSAGTMRAGWGGKFQPIWFNDDLDDLFTNVGNGISILPKVIAGKGRDAYALEIDSSLNITGYISGSASTSTQITKAWHHVAMTYDGANIKLYVDGVLKTTTAKTGAIATNSSNLLIGSTVPGKLDDMRIYNRALSQTEITALYQEYNNPGIAVSTLQKGLVGQWKFNGNAKDSTPNANDGVVTGAHLIEDRKGQVDQAYNFDGVNDFISSAYSNAFDFGANSFSINAWFKQTPITATTTINAQVAASEDDGYIYGATYPPTSGISTTGTTVVAGRATGGADFGYSDSWYRFTGITIPQGSTINVAYLSLFEQSSAGTPLTKIYADDQNDPTAPTTAAIYNARTPTTAGVDMDGDPGGFAWYDSSSIISVIQELVDSYDYSNEAIQILHKDDGSGSGSNVRGSRSYDNTTSPANTWGPKLHIEYKTPQYLLSHYDEAGWKLWSGGQVCFGTDDDSTWGPDDLVCSTGTSYDDNAWHNVQVVKNGTTGIYLYIDGVLAGSNTSLTATGSLSGTTPVLYSGIDSDGSSNAWQGSLDDVRIYNRALSQAEITALSESYNNPGIAVSTLQKGLVGQWKFAGNAKDATPYGNNGTVTGAILHNDRKGQYGKAYSFDGNDYVNVSDPASGILDFTNSQSFSVGGWIKTSANFSNDAPIVDKLQVSFFSIGYKLFVGSDEIAKFIVGDSNGETVTANSNINIADGNWHYLMGVKDVAKDLIKIYVDGVEKESIQDTTTASHTNSQALSIGGLSGSGFFNGLIDDVRIYNRALTPAEITALYQSY